MQPAAERSTTGDDRNARIERIVKEVMVERCEGKGVAFSEVEDRYPELMPELGERFRTLEAIEAAAEQAQQTTAAPHSNAPYKAARDAELEYLREQLLGYKILERIHRGGQGAVYKAIQRSPKRTLAIKFLLDGPLASDRQRQRFKREVDLACRVRHPNIVSIHESGVVGGRPFFTMDFIDGLPIDDYALLHGLTVTDRVRLLSTVCRAVSSAHQMGIIHRDLKPSNILIDPDGGPHILDFGLAKDVLQSAPGDDAERLSVTGQVVGTLPYLSPEQAGGEADQVDVRSDIYTLGVILFELLTARFPYPVDGNRLTTLANIRDREAIRVRKALSRDNWSSTPSAGEINDDLERIVLKALEKDKSRRYQSAAALADDLDRYLTGDAVAAKSASNLYLLKKTIHRFRVHVAIAAAFMILLVVALVGVTVAWRRTARVAQIAQAGLEMGSFLRLGSVGRDAGRIDQAVAMFEKAIETGAYVSTSDPVVQRYTFQAHQRLAELYLREGKAEDARPHCIAASQVAEHLARNEPANPEWQRLWGFSYVLRGQWACATDRWKRAIQEFGDAASIRKNLLLLEPGNPSLRSELAYVCSWQGKCHQTMSDFEEALTYYMEACNLYEQLSESEPDVPDHAIELSRMQAKVAVCHLHKRTVEYDVTALDWLARAENRMLELRDSGHFQGREWYTEKLLSEIRANKQLALRRTDKRSEPPN